MLSSPSTIFSSVILLGSLLIPTYAIPTSIWHVSIDEGPAPPPDKGPALSAHASRDPALLKYQIVGIVAAYLLCLCVATTVIAYGRRLQRKALSSNQSLGMEMVKPAAKVDQTSLGAGPNPMSPRREEYKPWVGPAHGNQSKQSQVSVSTVEEEALEAHKAKDMDDLERLYAAVMLQDEQSSHHTRTGLRGDQTQASSVYSQAPTELQHLNNIGKAVPLSPTSPNRGVGPTPIDETFQTTTRASPLPNTFKKSPKSLSITAQKRSDSSVSIQSRPSMISVRGQDISTPMGSADLRESAAYSDEAPLSPRLYTPGPPPPTPGHKSAAAQAREVDGERRSRFHIPSALSKIGRNTPVTNSTGTLPFRQNYAESMKSAPATKTTFLDKRENVLHPAGPKTGVPFTPYSPYMPYTPLTPVTPRVLVTKEERKRKQKRAAMKVVSEDDLVASDDDMWSTVR